MTQLWRTCLLALGLCAGCFYPEVVEGGFETEDSGTSSGPLPLSIAWCEPSSTYHWPCECEDQQLPAVRACSAEFRTLDIDDGSGRTVMRTCIQECVNAAGCDTPFCACVASCHHLWGPMLSDSGEADVGAAYSCRKRELRERCPSQP